LNDTSTRSGDAAGGSPAAGTTDVHQTILRRRIADLRSRLLNLTLSNKLLNFTHADRSRGFVRVVDELPDVLFGKLDGAMRFKPLPALEDDPPDEQTDAFRMAVDAARVSDEPYRAELAALEEKGETDDAGEQAEAIERRLKDRVRAAMSMPPRQEDGSVSLAEHARLHGISPSFDLPSADADATDGRWQDREIQLLLLPETAERKLSGLLDLTQEYLQETGINTLYAAIGFLQWYESTNSDRALYAPLMLLPLSMKRTLDGHEYVYAIGGTGDEPQVNISLREKLKSDFGLALPELAEEETPESYFARVAEAIERERRWRVRRWVTVGIFPFARMALYNDLNPDNWPQDKGLLAHEVISEMLLGRGSGGSEEPRDVDDAIIAEKLPLLITDADSSQAGAIIDAMERPTLVVKGPPGTGKSQTITNLIAAALDRGQRVLFVAEKLAALNVVHSRLKAAGLADYCLELHSDKARKADVLASLKARLEYEAPSSPARLEAKLTDLAVLRNELNRYAQLLNATLGQTGLTVHEVLWAAQRSKAAGGDLPEEMQRVTLANATTLTVDYIGQSQAVLDAIEKAYQAVARDGRGLGNHPWRGVCKSPLTPFDIEDIGDCLLAWRQALTGVAAALSAMQAEIGWAPAPKLAAAGLVDAFADLAAPGEQPLRLPLLAALQDDATRASVQVFLEQLAEKARLQASLHKTLEGPIAVVPSDLVAIGETAATLECGGLTPAGVGEALAGNQRKRDERQGVVAAALELAAAFGRDAGETMTAADVAPLVAAAALLSETPREQLAARTPALREEGVKTILGQGRDEAARLTKAAEEFGRLCHIEREPTAEILEGHAARLRSAGTFAVFSASYRAAKEFSNGFLRGPRTGDRSQMAQELDDVAQHIRAVKKLAGDVRLSGLCGSRFAGLATDFALLIGTCAFVETVRTQFAGLAPALQSLRAILIEGDMATLDGIRALAAKPSFRSLTEMVQEEGANTKRPLRQAVDALDARIAGLGALDRQIEATGLKGKALRLQQLPSIAAEIVALGRLTTAVNENADVRRLLGAAFADDQTDVSGLAESMAYVERLLAGGVPAELRAALLTDALAERAALLRRHASALRRAVETAEKTRQAFGAAARIDWHPFLGGLDASKVPVADLLERIDVCNGDRVGLAEWSGLLDLLETGRKHRLGVLLDGLLAERRPLRNLFACYEYLVYRSMARDAYQLEGGLLARHSGIGHESLRQRFRDLDREILQLNRRKLAADLLRRPVPYGIGRGRKAEYTENALLQHEVEKARRHIPIRELVRRAGGAILALKPCFMMSPLSIAQYIPPGTLEFDLLIIDEASQMKPEEAIGAFARAKRVVVVGDPKQLPPTSFFERNLQAPVDEEEEPEETIANESILDMAMAAFRPARTLRWHYRSRHGSLIAFSNRHFYDDQLIVFPTPNHRHPDFGVRYRHVNGVYDAGTNPLEAKAVCEAAVTFMHRYPDRSLAIVTLNQAQRELIREEMERMIAADDKASVYVERWSESLEPFVVKNLELVQGDERDCVYISTVYGPDRNGSVMQRFGPINSVHGHRRLNVLFSRAKLQTVVFSSMTADQVRAEPSSSLGVHALKGYLSYAATGMLDGGKVGDREPDSDFEVAVAEQIRATGCDAVAQVGVAGFFIDLGVKHPAFPHGYLLGIECDGATYHSGKAARDRDRLRQDVLESLGWDLHRIWSTDWFRNPAAEVEKLRKRIEAAIREKTATFGADGLDRDEEENPDDDSGPLMIVDKAGQARLL
jgi:very-short-patch-repair endonuclease